MSPLDVVIWTCVIAFVVTTALMLLHMMGIFSFPNPRYGRVLFGVLIIELAGGGAAAFSKYLSQDYSVADNTEDNSFSIAIPEGATFGQAARLISDQEQVSLDWGACQSRNRIQGSTVLKERVTASSGADAIKMLALDLQDVDTTITVSEVNGGAIYEIRCD